MRWSVYVVACCLLASHCQGAHFFEDFEQGGDSKTKWVQSEDSRYSGQEWEWAADDGNTGIRVAKPHKFYGLSRVLDQPVKVGAGEPAVIQYEVKYTDGVTCSGSYLKLLAHDDSFDPKALVEASGYSIMFGPDNCGATSKVHVIFRQENPITKKWEEKHMTKSVSAKKDKLTHLYTLELHTDNTFVVKVDGKKEAYGNLLSDDDFNPSFNQPKEIDDPDDKKPSDWVDSPKMPDPAASKPDDWDEDAPKKIEDPNAVKPSDWLDDEPSEIPDPKATIPEDWDEEDDGEWEAPMVDNPKCSTGHCGEWKRPLIDNPEYKGKWSPPMIDNPDYKGVWKPRRIENPGYFTDDNPLGTIKPIGAVAIEILANDNGIHFDSIMVSNDLDSAADYAGDVFQKRHSEEETKNKEASKAARKLELEKALNEGGVAGMATYYYGVVTDLFTEWWETSPLLVTIGMVAALLVPILFALRPSSKDNASHKKNDDAKDEQEDDDGNEGEDEAEDEEEEEEEDQSNVKKRIPRA
eukprot:CAMPEP_0203763188 /NCGR_PEP_ID=MMETSP0098-20131031/15837_1 /ASSEMBLY_ACC=CAM_ASM_000208 /TAXON_ID=96639 /ORGANISM=" , Strain NY0313808BC1" /LENGTH=521 /DNA_ID=CAMNT_0050657797 /DNA_START=944 /DNA_END=2509 /DNA_ORIENTATION=-